MIGRLLLIFEAELACTLPHGGTECYGLSYNDRDRIGIPHEKPVKESPMPYRVLLQANFYDAERGGGNRYEDITDLYFLGSREVNLPFPPFPGLTLHGLLAWAGEEGEEECAPEVESVTWDNAAQQFEVWLEHECGGDLEGGVKSMAKTFPGWSFELVDEREEGEE
jgi:hypothetical protein